MNGRPPVMRRAVAVAAALVALAAGVPAVAAPSDARVGGVVASLEAFPSDPVTPDEGFAVTVAVDNLGTTPLDDAAVSFAVTREPLADVDAVAAFLDGDGGDAGTRTVARSQVGTVMSSPAADEASTRLPGGVTTDVDAVATADVLDLPVGEWGVYGVVVRLETEEGWTVIDRGALTWAGTDLPGLRVATMAVAAGDETRVRTIAGAADVPGATLALDGSVLGPVGTAAMGLSTRDAYRLPSQHPDLVSLAHAADDQLFPYALARSQGSGTAATRDLPWLAVATVFDRTTIAYALEHDAAAVLLEGGAALAAGAGAALREVSVTAGGVPVVVPNPTLSATALATEVTAPARAVAEAALLAGAGAGTIAVSPGSDWSPPAGVSPVLTALAEAPFVTPIDLTTLLAEGPSGTLTGPRLAGESGDLERASIAGLAVRLDHLRDLALTAEDGAAVLDPGGAALLAPLTTTLRATESLRSARLADAAESVDAALGSLRVAVGSDINLIAARGSVPVTVRNDLDVDATVRVDVTSFSPNLQIRDTPTVTLAAGTTQTVLVEVEAVSSADVVASIVLRNSEGASVSSPVTLSVRVRADWDTAVTAFFTAGLVLLLVMGVVRTIRRGRKETRTGPREFDDAEGAG